MPLNIADTQRSSASERLLDYWMAAYDIIWEEALNALRQKLPDFHFKTFFINARPFFEDHGVYFFEVSSPNEKALLEKKYADDVRTALTQAYETLKEPLPEEIDVVYMSPKEAVDFRSAGRSAYLLNDDPEEDEQPDRGSAYEDDDFEELHEETSAPEDYAPSEPSEPEIPVPSRKAPAARPKPAASAASRSPIGSETLQLNPDHTFDSFVVGESNRLASAAAYAVAHSPGQVYNPLFLHGGVGLGKTHLMHAIGNEIKRLFPEKKIVYVTSETFTNELIYMIRSASSMDRRQEFRNKYRKADVLMIDDIQFIVGKDTTQDEFFHTFNELHGDHKQIVISSDRPPTDLTQLEERIRSRFEWGLTADITLPDYETRLAILQRKAAERPDMLPMDEDVFFYMAEQRNVNIRSLEGALTRVNMYATLHQADHIDMATAQSALQEIFRSKHHSVSAQQVCTLVGEYYEVEEKDLLGSRRTKTVAFARQVAMYITRKLTDLSFSKIAEHFKKKDHTTVLHAVSSVEKAMEANANVKKEVDDIIARLRST